MLLKNADLVTFYKPCNLGYKTGLSFTKWESWVTNGILGLLFTHYLPIELLELMKIDILLMININFV